MKCSESPPNHACCDYESYIYLPFFESPNTRQLEETGVNKPKMNYYPGLGGRRLINGSKSRWPHIQEKRQMLPPPEALIPALVVLGMDSSSWTNLRGGCQGDGWVMWAGPILVLSQISGHEFIPRTSGKRAPGSRYAEIDGTSRSWEAQLSLAALLDRLFEFYMVPAAVCVCASVGVCISPLVGGYDIPVTVRMTDSTWELNMCSVYI